MECWAELGTSRAFSGERLKLFGQLARRCRVFNLFIFFGGGVVPKMAQGIIQPNTESGACSYMMTGWHDGMMGT